MIVVLYCYGQQFTAWDPDIKTQPMKVGISQPDIIVVI